MAANAPQIQFRKESIAGFEQNKSLLMDSVTSEAVFNGNQATFLVADSGGRTATTRGSNGNIPAGSDNNAQLTATLVEKHDLVEKTGFNIFESQGDQRSIMQRTSRAVINRDIDQVIIDNLNTATVTWGAAAVASLALVTKAKAKLGNAKVPFDGNICAAITPAFEAKLLSIEEFGSADYVTKKPLEGGTGFDDQVGYYMWLGVKWIVHPELPGVGTAGAKSFMYHKNAIGHAANTGGLTAAIGFEEKQDKSWARTSIYHGGKLLQNSGIIVMNHDDNAVLA